MDSLKAEIQSIQWAATSESFNRLDTALNRAHEWAKEQGFTTSKTVEEQPFKFEVDENGNARIVGQVLRIEAK